MKRGTWRREDDVIGEEVDFIGILNDSEGEYIWEGRLRKKKKEVFVRERVSFERMHQRKVKERIQR